MLWSKFSACLSPFLSTWLSGLRVPAGPLWGPLTRHQLGSAPPPPVFPHLQHRAAPDRRGQLLPPTGTNPPSAHSGLGRSVNVRMCWDCRAAPGFCFASCVPNCRYRAKRMKGKYKYTLVYDQQSLGKRDNFLAETSTVLSGTQATAGAASPSWDRGKILLSFSECETNPLLNRRGASREAGTALNALTEVLVSPSGCSQCSCCQPGTTSSPS